MTSKQARIRVPLRDGIVEHPDHDAWYISKTPRLEDIEVPLLVCGSFSDHLLHTRGSFEVFRRAGSRHKWLYTHRGGKWSAYYSEDATRTRIRFFDYTLKGLANGWDQQPAVRLAITDAGPDPVTVVHEDTWPPRDVEWKKLWLDATSHTMHLGQEPSSSATAKFRPPKGRASFLCTCAGGHRRDRQHGVAPPSGSSWE